MKLKIQGRQTGKTFDIAEKMENDENSICIQPTQMHKKHFCKVYNFDKERVFTFNEVIMNPNLTKDKLIYIDELTGCLQMFFRGKIEYATVTALCEFKPFTGEYLGEFRT